MKKPSSETDYLCTCCHSIFKQKTKVVFFIKKNYDFENKCVQVALSEQVRCKNSIYEHICKNCHNQLKNTFPRIPENAHFCLENPEKFCNRCTTGNSKGLQGGKKKQMNKNVGADFWLHIFEKVGNTSSFDEAKSYMDKVKLLALDKKFKSLRQLIHDRLDSLAFHHVPNDVGVSKDDLFAVFTSSAGSCFYYTLSRLVYGNEDHVIEMRVRVLKEGFKNIDIYLDHNYLCRGYDFPYADDVSLLWKAIVAVDVPFFCSIQFLRVSSNRLVLKHSFPVLSVLLLVAILGYHLLPWIQRMLGCNRF